MAVYDSLAKALAKYSAKGYQYVDDLVRGARNAASTSGEAAAAGGAVPPGRTFASTSTTGSGSSTALVTRGTTTPVSSTVTTATGKVGAEIIDVEFTEVIKQGGLKGLFKNGKFAKLSRNQKALVITGAISAGTVSINEIVSWMEDGSMSKEVSDVIAMALNNSDPVPPAGYDPSADTSIHDAEIDKKVAGESIDSLVVSYERVKYARDLYDRLCRSLGKGTVDALLEFINLDDDLQMIGTAV